MEQHGVELNIKEKALIVSTKLAVVEERLTYAICTHTECLRY